MTSGFLLLLFHEPPTGPDVQFELLHHPGVLLSPFDKLLQRNPTWIIDKRNRVREIRAVYLLQGWEETRKDWCWTLYQDQLGTHCHYSCPPVQIFFHKCLRCSPWHLDCFASLIWRWSEETEKKKGTKRETAYSSDIWEKKSGKGRKVKGPKNLHSLSASTCESNGSTWIQIVCVRVHWKVMSQTSMYQSGFSYIWIETESRTVFVHLILVKTICQEHLEGLYSNVVQTSGLKNGMIRIWWLKVKGGIDFQSVTLSWAPYLRNASREILRIWSKILVWCWSSGGRRCTMWWIHLNHTWHQHCDSFDFTEN